MKRTIVAVAALLAPAFVCCTKQQAKSALDIAQALCVIANASLDVPAIATVCGIDAQLTPAIKQAIDDYKAQQAAAAKRASAVHPGDAGK